MHYLILLVKEPAAIGAISSHVCGAVLRAFVLNSLSPTEVGLSSVCPLST